MEGVSKMGVGWLLDGDLFDGYRDKLVAAIREQGYAVKLIHAPSPPFRWEDAGCSYRETFEEDACVIAHGDIELVTRIQRERRWSPGVFATVDNFYCSSYACWYGEYLLNSDYAMLPFGELERCEERLFDVFGREGQIFIRPDSPLKLFAGQIAQRTTFSADLEFMAFHEFPPSTLVVVSTPKEIVNEWRFVVACRKIIAGCQYRNGADLDYQPGYEHEAYRLARSIASLEYQPDPVWVMDICKTSDGRYHLLEIGGFSFADLYACDMNEIVAGVSAAAYAVWEKRHLEQGFTTS